MSPMDASKQHPGNAAPGGSQNPGVTLQGLLDTAAIATMPVPVVGDAIGLLADAKRMYDQPAERTPMNVALAAIGLLPFMPPAGVIGGKIKRLLGSSNASKSASIYDPKPLPQRLFEHDYPNPGAVGRDGSGRITTDIEGRLLTAPYVAGRRTPGSVDEGIRGVDQDRVAELLGISRQALPRSGPDLRGDFGRYWHADRLIGIDQRLPFEQAGRVFSHELGHAIDKFTFGQGIPTDGLRKELSRIYEDLNTAGNFKPGRGATPKTLKYRPDEHDSELMAEAIRAYLTDPNYIKTVAPKTAARIREYVNTNPNLNRVVQFNQFAPAALGGGLLMQQEEQK